MAARNAKLVAVSLVAFVTSTLAAEPPPIFSAGAPSVEDFFRKSQYGGAVLSPSGRYLAVIVPVGGHRGPGIIDLDTRTAVRTMTAGDGDVVRIVWQSDERLIAFLGDLQQPASRRASGAWWLSIAMERTSGFSHAGRVPSRIARRLTAVSSARGW